MNQTQVVENNFCRALVAILNRHELDEYLSKIIHIYLNLRDGHSKEAVIVDREITEADMELMRMVGEIYRDEKDPS